MELNNIKTKDISWGEAASALNENFGKIGTDVEKIKNATIKNKGYYASVADLTSAFPSAQIGDYAYVGSQAPYQTWHWTIEGWEKLNDDGGNINVNLNNYYPKSEVDGKLSELASEVSVIYSNRAVDVSISESGYYIDKNGTKTSSVNFALSSPILLKQGEIISVILSGYNTVSVISLYENGNYKPLVIGTISDIRYEEELATYQAQKDCYVVLSSYVNKFPEKATITRIRPSAELFGLKQEIGNISNNVLYFNWRKGTILTDTGKEADSTLNYISGYVPFNDIYDASVVSPYILYIMFYDRNYNYIGYSGTIKEKGADYAYYIRFMIVNNNYNDGVSSLEVTNFSALLSKGKVYSIIDDVNSKASNEDVDALFSNLDFSFKYENTSVQRNEFYVKYADGAITSSVNFAISLPIFIKNGEVLTTTARAYDSVSVISLTDAEGSLYTPLVRGMDMQKENKYSYKAKKDCYVAITSYIKAFPEKVTISRSSVAEDIEKDLELFDKHISDIGKCFAVQQQFNKGGWYNTYASDIGGTASMEYNEDSSYNNINTLVKKGDVFYITGTGGNSPRLWALLDENNTILKYASKNATENGLRIEIHTDCRLVVNVLRGQPHSLMKEEYEIGKVDNIELFSKLEKQSKQPLFKVNYFNGFAGIFHHWGFVGDSLMGGFMENIGKSMYEYSWGQRMCKLLGVEGYNFSVGGQTVKGWIEEAKSSEVERFKRSWGGAKTNIKQAYIIGLGVNDRAQDYAIGDVNTDIGTYDAELDLDTNAETYAGYYAGIIQRLQSVNPTAKIFVVTLPDSGSANINDYNGVIRGMAEKFANVYVIDLYENAYNFYSKEWKENLWDSGHFNVIGYEYCASVMAQYIDWIIRNNYSDFKDANLIPFTEPE